MIGENITQIRKLQGMTLTELAEKANISKSNLSNIERGINVNPSIKVLEKIAEVLHTELGTLLGLEQIHPEKDKLVERLEKLNLTEVEMKQYEKVLEFIEWQKKNIRSDEFDKEETV